MADASIAPLDRLPAEIRVEVFGLALRYDTPMVAADKGESAAVALLVALVNDQKYDEAYEAFYGSNTFRLTEMAQLYNMTKELCAPYYSPLSHVTHLELTNFSTGEFFGPDNINKAIGLCSQMPKLRSLVVAHDHLAFDFRHYRMHGVQFHDVLGRQPECVGIGHYQLRLENNFVIDFKHYGMVHAWLKMKASKRTTLAKTAKRIQKQNSGPSDFRLGVDGGRLQNSLVNFTLTDWASSLDGYRQVLHTAEGAIRRYSELENLVLNRFRFEFQEGCCNGKVYECLSQGTSFRDIDEERCDAKTLQAISDMLLANDGFSIHLEKPYSRHWHRPRAERRQRLAK
ncbi:hypothetical protein LTS10_008506 [Elasticomyces elasticus]|nr:hypothetical protein LTS10_008506 [Elasticomyces elasticus]